MKIAPFGVTIFDAPRDVIVEQVGFSILDYAGDPSRLGTARGRDLRRARPARDRLRAPASSRPPIRQPPRARPAHRVARRSPRSRSCPSTRGCPGRRSATPATRRWRASTRATRCRSSSCSRRSLAWAIGRLPRAGSRCAFEVALLAARRDRRLPAATRSRARATSCSPPIGLAAAGRRAAGRCGACAATRPCSSRRPSSRRSCCVAGAHRVEQRINDGRYLGSDPRDRRPAEGRARRQADRPRRRLVGRRADADLARVRHADRQRGRVHRLLRRLPAQVPDRGRASRTALQRGRYDAIVVGRGFYPPQDTREQRWAIDAGWRTIALSDAPARARPAALR